MEYLNYFERKKHRIVSIRTVVFDIGNVLVTFDWNTYLERNFSDNTIIYEIQKTFSKRKFWEIMDMGLLSESEIISYLKNSASKYSQEIVYAYNNLGNSISKCEYTIPWILELKKFGLQVLYLSNYSFYTIVHNPQVFDFLDYMDGGILSSEVHILKPDVLIYQILFEKYKVSPSQSVLIDDSLHNINTANMLSMETVLFQKYTQAHRDLSLIISRSI